MSFKQNKLQSLSKAIHFWLLNLCFKLLFQYNELKWPASLQEELKLFPWSKQLIFLFISITFRFAIGAAGWHFLMKASFYQYYYISSLMYVKESWLPYWVCFSLTLSLSDGASFLTLINVFCSLFCACKLPNSQVVLIYNWNFVAVTHLLIVMVLFIQLLLNCLKCKF